MSIIAINQDSENILSIHVNQGKKIIIPAGGSVDLLEECTRVEIAQSDAAYHLDQGDIIINDGDKDLSKLNALRIVMDAPPPDELRDPSGKLRVHQTSRKIGTKIHWTGEGDDTSNVMAVGGGESISFVHDIGAQDPEPKYIDFNIVENETWVHEGYLTWKDAMLDSVTLEVVPRTVSVVPASGTQYDIYGGYLVVPNPYMTGSYNVTSDITTHSGGLVFVPIDENGERPSPCYWNATWNTTTKEFENIAMAPYGDGEYNMFSYEVVISRFINKLPLLHSGFIALNSSDADQLGQGMRLKITFDTNKEDGPDHAWAMASTICLHRARSV